MRTGGGGGAPSDPWNAGAPARGLQPAEGVGAEPPSPRTPETVAVHETGCSILVNGPRGEASFLGRV